MSQNSQYTTSSQYTFTPINHNGDGDCNTQSTATSSTRLDKAVASVAHIHNDAIALTQSIQSIDSVLKTLTPTRFNGKVLVVNKLNALKQTLKRISLSIDKDASILSPVPGMQYVQQRRRTVSPVETATNNNNNDNSKRCLRLKQPPPKRFKHKNKEIEYPAPSNGTSYTPKETVDILESNPNDKSCIINQMISTKQLSVHRSAVYKLLQRTKDGVAIPCTWGLCGRKPIATEVQIKEKITSTMIDKPGLTLGKDDVAQSLLELKRQRMIDSGVAPIGAIAAVSFLHSLCLNYISKFLFPTTICLCILVPLSNMDV